MTQRNFITEAEPLASFQGGDAKALARRSDPENSHEAARHIVESGGQESQCAAILDLLRLRPVTAKELVKLSVKYTSRISEIRQAGHHIECRKVRDADTDKWTFIYILIEGDDG